eukprot:1914955-Amphidinium_carterae.1
MGKTSVERKCSRHLLHSGSGKAPLQSSFLCTLRQSLRHRLSRCGHALAKKFLPAVVAARSIPSSSLQLRGQTFRSLQFSDEVPILHEASSNVFVAIVQILLGFGSVRLRP